jgi:hypothetical protein
MVQSVPVKIKEGERISTTNSIIYLVLALALIRGIIYAAVVPPWQAPDEPAHFERVRAALVAEEWQGKSEDPGWYHELRDSLYIFGFGNYIAQELGSKPDQPLRDYIGLYHEIYGGLYGSRLTYALIGAPLFLTPTQNITLQLYLVRLNMVLMGVGIVLLAYLTARTAFPQHPFIFWGVPILILFNPQHSHMLSTVNNGNLAELLTATFFYLSVRGLREGFSRGLAFAILVSALVAMWAKATAYFLVVPIGVLGLIYLWRYRHLWRWLFLLLILLTGVIYALAPSRLKLLTISALSNLLEGNFNLDPDLIPIIFRSYWAVPGWLILNLNLLWYHLILAACLLAVIGLVILLIRHRSRLFLDQSWPQVQLLILFGVAIITAFGIQIGWQIITASTNYNQGRTLYPVMIPISTFLMLGWHQFVPQGWYKTGLLAIAALLFLFDTLVLFDYIFPFFYARS